MKCFLMFAWLAIVATQLGNGCVSDDGGSGNEDYRPAPSRPDEDYDRNNRIPSRASLVEEGRDQLRWRADSDGRVYVYDADDRRVLGSYDIVRGREFIVSPKDDRAWIDDKRVLDYDFNREHEHRIYILRDGTDSGGTATLPRELRDAERVAFGRGDLRFNPQHGGNVWVYDYSDEAIVYKVDLRKSEQLVVSPSRSRITIRDVESRASFKLNAQHDYGVFYKRDDRIDQVAGPTKPEPVKPDPAKPQPGQPTGPVFGGGAGATVPKTATIEREGKGSDLSFEAPGVGTVFIYDIDGKTTIATYNLKKGQRFTVSPASGEAAVDGKVVIRKSMSTKKAYRLYFNLNV